MKSDSNDNEGNYNPTNNRYIFYDNEENDDNDHDLKKEYEQE